MCIGGTNIGGDTAEDVNSFLEVSIDGQKERSFQTPGISDSSHPTWSKFARLKSEPNDSKLCFKLKDSKKPDPNVAQK